MSEQVLSYGECPRCGTSCQPPDAPDKDGHEFCYCCDCEIMWMIVHNEKNNHNDTWKKHWPVIDIVSFELAGFIPYGCDED